MHQCAGLPRLWRRCSRLIERPGKAALIHPPVLKLSARIGERRPSGRAPASQVLRIVAAENRIGPHAPVRWRSWRAAGADFGQNPMHLYADGSGLQAGAGAWSVERRGRLR